MCIVHHKTDLPKVTNIFSKAGGLRIKKELNLKLENLVTLYIKKMGSLAKVTVKEKGNPRPLLYKKAIRKDLLYTGTYDLFITAK